MKTIMLMSLLLSVSVHSAEKCGNLFTEKEIKIENEMAKLNRKKSDLPDVIQDLDILFDHQTRTFPQKGKEYSILKVNRNKLGDPIYKRFQQSTVEILISGTGGGSGFRHIILRVGEKVYDYGSVRESRAGELFRAPSDRKDAKGVVFHVGQQKVQDVQYMLEAFYDGNNKYNNPPFSAVGGKLVVIKEGGKFRFKSEERIWIPGAGENSVSIVKNNDYFEGKIVEDVNDQGTKRLMLENPMGLRIPVSTQQDGVTHYVEGFSCASSAVFVLDALFNIKVFNSVSAANLVKKLSEGNNDFESTPDAIIMYGAEKKEATVPFEVATNNYAGSIAEKNMRNQAEQEKQLAAVAKLKAEEAKAETVAPPVAPVVDAPKPVTTNKVFAHLAPPEQSAAPKKSFWTRVANFFGF
jgi:hypothetical protein